MDPTRWQALETLMRHLNGAIKTMALYPGTHPAAVKFQLNIHQTLERLLEQQESTQVGVTGEDLLVVEGTPWMGPAEQIKNLQDRLQSRELGAVTFLRGIAVEEVRALLEVLAMDGETLAAQGGAARALAAKGAHHLMVTSIKPAQEDAAAGSLDRRQAVVVYNKAVGAARALMQKVAMGQLPQAAEVRQVVAAHGGSILARNRAGGGAEFVVRLPLASETVAAAGDAHHCAPPAHRRVLIIEDNVDAVHSLRQVLGLGGHEIEVAYNGLDGLSKAREFKPDVVLCDIGLPEMDGYAVARAFRADEALRATRLVALTGYALPADVARAQEAGFDQHLAKPPVMEKLEEALAIEGAAAEAS